MRAFLRKFHRWIGLLIALQVFAWMVSGFYFSLFPIEQIRGEHLTREPARLEHGALSVAFPGAGLEAALDEQLGAPWVLESAGLTEWNGEVLWKIRGEASGIRFTRLVTRDGDVLPRLSREEAEQRAAWWLKEPAPLAGSEWVAPGTGGTEFRARGAAAWRIDFEGAEPVSLYIDPWSGDLLARRTARWRLFDFLWMLHIMDYDTREDFNHPLLQVAAVVGFLVALSGVVFWFLTRRSVRGRKRA